MSSSLGSAAVIRFRFARLPDHFREGAVVGRLEPSGAAQQDDRLLAEQAGEVANDHRRAVPVGREPVEDQRTDRDHRHPEPLNDEVQEQVEVAPVGSDVQPVTRKNTV